MPSSSRVGRISAQFPPPQQLLALQRRDRLDRVRPANDLHSCLREAKVLYLALPDQMALGTGESKGGLDNQHRRADQWLYVVSGTGVAEVNGDRVGGLRFGMRRRR